MSLLGVRKLIPGFLLLSLMMAAVPAQDSSCPCQLAKTKLMRGGDKAQAVSADVTGVRDLYLVVTFGGDSYQSDQAIWAEPRLTDKDGRSVDMTTLTPKHAQVGWGRLFVDENQKGRPLAIAKDVFQKGYWAHGPSLLHFQLDGKYTRFEAQVGIDKGAGKNGSVEFEVTSLPPKMPEASAFKKRQTSQDVKLKVSPAHEAPHEFNSQAARILLERGVEKLVFVRRFTLSANHVYTTKNLYRMDAGGGNMLPLSNSPVSEASPAMLPDGRILYHRWEYVDKAAGNLKCLWAMNPDGTASAEIYGNTITFPETMIYPRPIPGADGKIVMLGTSHCCPNNAMGAVIVIDTAKELRSPDTMQFVTDDIRALAHSGFHFRDETGQWKLDKTGTLGRLFKDPYPLSEDLFLATRKPKGPAWNDVKAYDLCLLDGQGNETPLYNDEEISCWHPYPLKSRQKPPVAVSAADRKLAERGLSLCVLTDVYTGMDDVQRGTVKRIRAAL